MKRLILLAALTLAACNEDEAKAPPPPVDLTEQALSYFCQMNIAEHGGPKGQIHLDGHPAPLFFAQVRDLMAYLKSPERDAEITAVYVSDMGSAPSWSEPGDFKLDPGWRGQLCGRRTGRRRHGRPRNRALCQTRKRRCVC